MSQIRAYSQRTKYLGTNIFAEFSKLATRHRSINLGQGFPSFGSPQFLKDAAINAILAEHNQYTRPGGHPQLVQTLADFYSKEYGRSIDAINEIVTFNGAQEGIFSIFAAILDPGDEVIIIEPYFDAYVNAASILDLKISGIPLELSSEAKRVFDQRTPRASVLSSDLRLDLTKLEKAITSKTKLIVLNTPHNPTGKVFSKDELNTICTLLEKYPHVTILSDEVYEFMCYDGLKHERIATYPGMFDRVISLFSAGKTFSCTGWRVGYCICPKHLASPILKMHNAIPFCAATPLEIAVGEAFSQAQCNGYFEQLPIMLSEKRDAVVEALRQANMQPIVPEGGYFVIADSSAIGLNRSRSSIKTTPSTPLESYPDYQMCQLLTKEAGITVIPTSPFYSPPNRHLAGNSIRIAFCKDDATISKACKILSQL